MNKTMDRNIVAIKRYFELSDMASNDEQALDEIIDLFADNVTIRSDLNGAVANKEEAIEFFRDFFGHNKELKHVFKIQTLENYYQIEWSLAGVNEDDKFFALHGFNYYRFDDEGKIISLLIEVI
ncbi:nuclear transport factor 2 family protein [Companilactobacillus hulinensis]|uniref:nuclear transport factor 2 family protein n=1 Tax=Companilactobacillus hulinensis TaxID=2486007 RepID=UPI000F76A897|nr:nuclear transport factor 2 family protein [Companilactobacillus hulinensis]